MKKFSILLIVAMLFTACGSSTSEQNTNTDEPAAIEVAVLDISGMHCDGCVNTITGAIEEIDGVQQVKVSLEYEQAKVKFDPETISADDIKEAIEEKGYGVTQVEVMPLKQKKVTSE